MNRSIRIPYAHAAWVTLAALVACALTAAPAAAWTSDFVLNTPICTAADNQSLPVIVPDDDGGVFIGWNDNRNGNTDLYVQHLDVRGQAVWAADGVPLCTAVDGQGNLKLLADGQGGVFAAWTDLRNGSGTRDIYAQRLNAAGVPQWTLNGVPVAVATNHQLNVSIVRGMASVDELLLVWEDWRSGATDIFVQGLTGNGVQRYLTNGVPLCTATGDQKRPTIVSDGSGGVIAAWQDLRSGTSEDIYAQRFVNGTVLWTANGQSMCTSAGNQTQPAAVSDGNGGIIVAWDDDRAGAANHDVYAQALDFTGLRLWGTNGTVVDNGAGTAGQVQVTSDGSHGAYVVWVDAGDIRAQRMTAAGLRAFTGGVTICSAALSQHAPQIASDGLGGAFITWYDQRTGEADIYAARLLASGQQPWILNGTGIGLATLHQFYPALAVDGRGAAIIVWGDGRLGNTSAAFDIYAQRIDRFGSLGEPEPPITSIVDVPDDEGGHVLLGWDQSPMVSIVNVADMTYRLWRATPALGDLATAAGARPERATTSDPDRAARAGGPLLAMEGSVSSTAWEWVATLPADLVPSYSADVPTAFDSVPGPNPPPTQFMVELRYVPLGQSRFSLPASGRSVDNLPPAAPAPFTAEHVGGETHLHWDPNAEPDFKVYILHRGTTLDFPPTPITYVATLEDTGYVDNTSDPYVYKLIAVDVHGNASPASQAVPGGTVDVPAARATLAFLDPAVPNPSRGEVTMRFGLSRPGRASLEVFDASGRRVRSLLSGDFAAGGQVAQWDGRDARGTLCPAGLYFVRLQTEEFRAQRRLVRTR